MLEPLRNPASWDNFRKVVVLVLILWTAVSAVLCIIYFFILGGRTPAPVDIFRARLLLVPFVASGFHPTGSQKRSEHAASGSTCSDHACRELDHNGRGTVRISV
jgi:hypothetical protein